jgi:diaminopimelate decarboxylase
MKEKTSAPPTNASPRMELFFQRPIAIFNEESQIDSSEFAQQIASLKNLQANNEPFFVMNLDRVSAALDTWAKLLPRVRPFYTVECNSDPILLNMLAAFPIMGFKCRPQNLDDVLALVPPERILHTTPTMWTRNSLEHAFANDVQLLSFDSARDLDRIALAHPNAELILNVNLNPGSDDLNAVLGCEQEEAPHLLAMASELCLHCVGIAFNLGNSYVRPSAFVSAIKDAASIFDVGLQLGHSLTILNIGDGFIYPNEQKAADFLELCIQIDSSLNHYFPLEYFPQLKIIAMPGRYFCESAFVLVTNIIGRRSVNASLVTNDDFDAENEAFIYQTNEGYYGAFSCGISDRDLECRPLFAHELDFLPSAHTYGSILGPTLADEFDVVQSIVHFRQLSVGDWLIWNNLGAYSLNGHASLGEGDDRHFPIIFYFSSQTNWDRLGSVQAVITLGTTFVCSADPAQSEHDIDSDEDFTLTIDI